MRPPRGSSPAEVRAARGRGVPDIVRPRLRILFCGSYPGLRSGAVGHHFARPGNRFWKALHGADLTDRLLAPPEEREVLKRGIGITNLVNRASARADALDAVDLGRGARRLARIVRRARRRVVAILGLGAYRAAFGVRRASVGPQGERIAGARVWVLPKPSGRAAGYQLVALTDAFRELRRAAAGRS